MKKLTSVLVALLPLLYCVIMQAANLLHLGDELFLGSLGIYALLGILLPIAYDRTCYQAENKFLAGNNLWFYGINLALFIAEIVLWLVRLEENRIAEQNGAMEGGLGLVLLIVVYLPHWLSYLATRIAGAASCARTLRDACTPATRIFNVILQLFPGTDLLSGIWVYLNIRQNQVI